MKIFGIGLSRTGAVTLQESLESLGYRCYFVHTYEDLEENLPRYDAFVHTPVAPLYKELDNRFPDSKFILAVRETGSWLRSIEKQWAAVGAVSEGQREIRRRIYGTDRFDSQTLRGVYDRHLETVSHHFAGREHQLLILDICGGEAYGKLCPFLGKPVPEQPFPHKNLARDTIERPTFAIKRFAVRYLKASQIKRFLMKILGR